MERSTRREQIGQNLKVKQISGRDSEIMDGLMEKLDELSPLAKQQLAMHLLAQVAKEL